MSRSFAVASAALLVVFTACGGDGEGTPDARSPAADAPIVDARSEPDADDVVHQIDGGLRYTIPSNLPDAAWTATPSEEQATLTMVSSNLVQERLDGSVFLEWYAEVQNHGTETICQPHIDVGFFDPATVSALLAMDAYVDAAPHRMVGATSTPCLAPGAVGVLWTIREQPTEVALDQIRTAMYTASGSPRATALPHPLAPTVTSTVVERSPGAWAVEGTVRADAGAIHNVLVDVYPRGPGNWIVDRLTAANLGSILVDEPWAYQTVDAYRGERFSELRSFVSFIEGSGALAADDAAARWRADRHALAARRDAARAALR